MSGNPAPAAGRSMPSLRAMDDLRHHFIGVDELVPTVAGEMVSYVNLDNAATTPAMRAAMDAVDSVLPYYASVHRGSGYKARVCTEAYERARSSIERVPRRGPRSRHGDLHQEHDRGDQQAGQVNSCR